ncbi:dUTP diphosphatase [Bacillus sp. T33-2]|uniref:dUTP diphosphatase n=1 Tax=Bacillus sp. T33-2 TaxID=2054168 RepID=UPI000C78EA0A|nr:dUTP diphosphatase [Bacillus sp. T33-2]PLR98094.1 dUTPase [Bacillus sp. T33-2]
MNLEKLLSMQKELDNHIETKHGLLAEDLFEKKVLALLVELGELANETRCFKFWSVKPPSDSAVILEEFVDGVHFILSLGIEAGFDIRDLPIEEPLESLDINAQFLQVYEAAVRFRGSRSLEDYRNLFSGYIQLASVLGFSSGQIEEAYIKKNVVNYERQLKGY